MQDIAVKEQCLNFSNDSMLFLINFRNLKKTRDGRTDPRTDRPSYRDAWTHLKRQKLHLHIVVIFRLNHILVGTWFVILNLSLYLGFVKSRLIKFLQKWNLGYYLANYRISYWKILFIYSVGVHEMIC